MADAGGHQGSGDDLFFDSQEDILHPDAHDDGGLGLVDRRLLDEQRSAILELLKDLGRNLLLGNLNLLSLSMPVRMFESRSYLQKLTDVWVYPRYLAAAAEATDPVERLKLVATWYVAGLQHVFQSWRKPFNPILGETWAGSLSDGTAVYLEQVAHHPPVSAFEMIGPGGAYTFIGISQPEVGYKGMDVRTTARGARRLAFADGGAISVTFPHYYIRGVVGPGLPRGEMVGAATFTDAAHGLTCVLSFGKSPDPADRGVRLLQRGDTVTGAVYREDGLPAGSDGEVLSRSTSPTRPRAEGGLAATRSRPSLGRLSGFASALSLAPREAELAPRTAVATCKGNWLSHLDWDGVRAWTLAVEQPDEWRPVARPLPSDAGLRADLAALREARAEDDIGADPEGVQRAQRIKEEMERAQRADAKLRKAGGAAA